ncbi:ensconsin isoform X3 [Hypanus sabinus]|uniref:ensconsin isoform X3 n=1 Tax=Hypanus sabinus TaxID=79690 RepID=UPI0028C4CE5E|nr:ensconsin isoform X3 [Hypanus sabinus]
MAEGATSLKELRAQYVAAAQAQADERRSQSVNSPILADPSPVIVKAPTKPVIDGSMLKTVERQRLAKARREEKEKEMAAKEYQLLEKEKKARLQYEKQVEERQRKLEEQRQKEQQKRVAVEEKRKQKQEEEKERYEAVMRRTIERSQRLEQRQKRWSWGGAVSTEKENPNGELDSSLTPPLSLSECPPPSSDPKASTEDVSAADKRSPSRANPTKQGGSVMTKRLSSSSTALLNSPDKGTADKKRSSSLNRLASNPRSSTPVDKLSREDLQARRSQNSPVESNIINRLLMPTQSSLARSKSAAALPEAGQSSAESHLCTRSASAGPVKSPINPANKPLRSRSSDRQNSVDASAGGMTPVLAMQNQIKGKHPSSPVAASRRRSPSPNIAKRPPSPSNPGTRRPPSPSNPGTRRPPSPNTGTRRPPSPSNSGARRPSSPNTSTRRPPSPSTATRQPPSPSNPAARRPSSPSNSVMKRSTSPSMVKSSPKNYPSPPSTFRQHPPSPTSVHRPLPIHRPPATSTTKKKPEKETKPKQKLEVSGAEKDSSTSSSKSKDSEQKPAGTTSAEEAVKILAENRRLAREQKEREEQERLQLAEAERLRKEELKKKAAEEKLCKEEAARLQREERKLAEGENQREAEEERLCREHEEQERLADLRLQREEAEAREAERQRQERERIMQQNEQERLARRKRIKEIMRRTRKDDQEQLKTERVQDEAAEESGEDEPRNGDTDEVDSTNGIDELQDPSHDCVELTEAVGDEPIGLNGVNVIDNIAVHLNEESVMGVSTVPKDNCVISGLINVGEVGGSVVHQNGKSSSWIIDEFIELGVCSKTSKLTVAACDTEVCNQSIPEIGCEENGGVTSLAKSIEGAAEL